MSDPQQPLAPPDAAVAPPPEAPAPDLKQRAVRATIISVAGTVLAQAIRLGTNLVVSRLLSPELYGLMNLVITLDIGLTMMSDLGTRISIIHSKHGDEREFLDTAFTVELLRGAVLWAMAMAIAWPWASFYNDERLVHIVMAYALTALLNGAMSTKIHTLNRHMKMEPQVILDIVSMTAGSVFSIVYAFYVERSVWALVYGSLFNTFVKFLMGHFWLPGPLNRLRWKKEYVRSILSFGAWIFVSTLITFFAQRLDSLMIGRLFPLEILGLFGNAYTLAGVPMLLGGRVISSVLLPALTAVGRDDEAALSRTYDRGMRTVYMTGSLLCLGVALVSPAFYSLLYKPEWRDAGWIAQLMMLAVWFGYMQESAGRALQAVGDARSLAMANTVKLIVTAAGCYAGYHLAALPGFMLGAALGAAAGQVVIIIRLRKMKLNAGPADLKYTAAGIALGLVGTLVPHHLARTYGIDIAWLSLAASILIGGPAALFVGRRVYADIRRR